MTRLTEEQVARPGLTGGKNGRTRVMAAKALLVRNSAPPPAAALPFTSTRSSTGPGFARQPRLDMLVQVQTPLPGRSASPVLLYRRGTLRSSQLTDRPPEDCSWFRAWHEQEESPGASGTLARGAERDFEQSDAVEARRDDAHGGTASLRRPELRHVRRRLHRRCHRQAAAVVQ